MSSLGFETDPQQTTIATRARNEGCLELKFESFLRRMLAERVMLNLQRPPVTPCMQTYRVRGPSSLLNTSTFIYFLLRASAWWYIALPKLHGIL